MDTNRTKLCEQGINFDTPFYGGKSVAKIKDTKWMGNLYPKGLVKDKNNFELAAIFM